MLMVEKIILPTNTRILILTKTHQIAFEIDMNYQRVCKRVCKFHGQGSFCVAEWLRQPAFLSTAHEDVG